MSETKFEFSVGETVAVIGGRRWGEHLPTALLRVASVRTFRNRKKVVLEDGSEFDDWGASWKRGNYYASRIRKLDVMDAATIAREQTVSVILRAVGELTVEKLRAFSEADLNQLATLLGRKAARPAHTPCRVCERLIASEELRSHPEGCACNGCDTFCFGEDTGGCSLAAERLALRKPVKGLTDAEIAEQISSLTTSLRQPRDDDEGHGGSPGEWMDERLGELRTEKERRSERAFILRVERKA